MARPGLTLTPRTRVARRPGHAAPPEHAARGRRTGRSSRLAVPGLPRAGRRAAVPARRRRHRRPPRHPAARRARHRRRGAADRGRAVRLPRLRHHRRRWPGSVGAGDLRGALAQGVDGVWLAVLIGVVATRRSACRSPGRWSALFGAGPEVADAGHDVPAARLPRRRAAAGDARRDRGAARAAGHPDPAGRRGGRQPREHRAQPAAGLRRCDLGIAGSALGTRPRPARLGARRCSRSWSAPPAGEGALAAPGPAPASGAPRTPASPLVVRTLTLRASLLVDDVRRAPTLGATARGRPPARADDLDVPGLRPRRHRDRRPGHHRPHARRRRRRRHPRGHPTGWCAGGCVSGVVTGARRSRSPPRCSARCSPPTRAVRDLLVPVLLVAARRSSRSPAWCSSSTAC